MFMYKMLYAIVLFVVLIGVVLPVLFDRPAFFFLNPKLRKKYTILGIKKVENDVRVVEKEIKSEQRKKI